MIIFEGPEFAGKSTLAQTYIEEHPEYTLVHTGGPPEDDETLRNRIMSQLITTGNVVFDRSPIITEIIYGQMNGINPSGLSDEELVEYLQALMDMNPVIVYCRPSDALIEKYRAIPAEMITGDKPHKTVEHVRQVQEKMEMLRASYDMILGTLQEKGYPVFGVETEVK